MNNLCYKCEHEHECIKYTHYNRVQPFMKQTEIMHFRITDCEDCSRLLCVLECEKYEAKKS